MVDGCLVEGGENATDHHDEGEETEDEAVDGGDEAEGCGGEGGEEWGEMVERESEGEVSEKCEDEEEGGGS